MPCRARPVRSIFAQSIYRNSTTIRIRRFQAHRISPLTRRRFYLACSLLTLAAISSFVLLSGSGATAKASASSLPSYSALDSTEPTELSLVTPGSPEAVALGAKGPTFPASPTAGLASHGPVVDSIRKLPIGLPDVSAWIAKSAEGGICVLASRHQPVAKGAYGVGMSCVPAALLESGTVLELQSDGSDVGTIVGVVPDNVSAVQVTLSNGASETVPAAGNAWALESNAHFVSTQNVVGG